MADMQQPLTVATHDLRPPSPRAIVRVIAPESRTLTPEDICDVSIVERTNNFYYEDQSVLIKVEDEAFKVSRSLLSALSPVLRALLAPTQQLQTPLSAGWSGMKIVEFMNDSAQDVRDFLWYIHADGLTVLDFIELEPSNFKCGRLIGVATIAHKYEAMREAHWAVRCIFEMLEVPTARRKVTLNPATLARLHRLATRYGLCDVVKRTREIWADTMYDCIGGGPAGEAEDEEDGVDPVGMLMAAKEVGDEWLLGQAYYFVLRIGDERLSTETRLTAEDGRRLLVGARKLLLRAGGWASSSAAGTCPGSPMSVATPVLSHPPSRESSPGLATPTDSPGTPRRRSLVLHDKFYARVPDEIAPIRDQLWGMFTSNPWRLS